jgi:tetratricopeptide (TPR) repeat protein
MSFDSFIETAWSDHGDQPQQVADRLAASLGLVRAPEHVAPFARLLAHVFGEHLGEWSRAAGLLEALQALPAAANTESARVLARHIAALRFAGGDESALAPLATDDRIAALAVAASAFAGQLDFKRAIAVYDEALALAAAGLADGSPALRALAVGGNNLAAALEEMPDRVSEETLGMVRAAEGGLKYWKRAGTWLEEERAEYRLARSLLQAGNAAAARQHAERCIDVCQANDAPPFERFFGHAALGLAQRGAGDAASFEASCRQARALFDQVPADERTWCQNDLDELGPATRCP